MIRSTPKSDPDRDLEFRQLEDRLREQAPRTGRPSGAPSGLARRLHARWLRRRAAWSAGLAAAALAAALLSWQATRPDDAARSGAEPLAGGRNEGLQQERPSPYPVPRQERSRPAAATLSALHPQLERLPPAIPVVFSDDDNATAEDIGGFYLPGATRPVAQQDFTPAQWQAIREVLGIEPARSDVYPETI